MADANRTNADSQTFGRPTEEGGVWGSYVAYLEDCEDRIGRVSEWIAEMRRKASFDKTAPDPKVKLVGSLMEIAADGCEEALRGRP